MNSLIFVQKGLVHHSWICMPVSHFETFFAHETKIDSLDAINAKSVYLKLVIDEPLPNCRFAHLSFTPIIYCWENSSD